MSKDVTVIPVGGAAAYDVLVGHGVRERVPALVSGSTAVAVVADASVSRFAEEIASGLDAAGMRTQTLVVGSGEAVKSLERVADLWGRFAAMRLSRSDAVVAVGGGAVTDAAGFAAATWLRGVRVVHVPSTLLGMVDAAVGGKTGVNTDAGKNLVGAFHPPAAVAVDLDLLEGLPAAEWVNGLAEVVKAGFIADAEILRLIESDLDSARRPDGAHTRELVERSIRMKASVVTADLREAGPREMLNYGHTLGHAIERLERYRWPHGHAVSVGMVFAAALARRAGRLDDATADRHRDVLTAVGLPVTYRADALPELLEVMSVDKKVRGDRIRFVVLDGLARPGILEAPDPTLLSAAYGEVAA